MCIVMTALITTHVYAGDIAEDMRQTLASCKDESLSNTCSRVVFRSLMSVIMAAVNCADTVAGDGEERTHEQEVFHKERCTEAASFIRAFSDMVGDTHNH